MAVLIYTVIRQSAKPSIVNQKTGQIWVKTDIDDNDVAMYIFIGDDFYPLIAGAF